MLCVCITRRHRPTRKYNAVCVCVCVLCVCGGGAGVCVSISCILPYLKYPLRETTFACGKRQLPQDVELDLLTSTCCIVMLYTYVVVHICKTCMSGYIGLYMLYYLLFSILYYALWWSLEWLLKLQTSNLNIYLCMYMPNSVVETANSEGRNVTRVLYTSKLSLTKFASFLRVDKAT